MKIIKRSAIYYGAKFPQAGEQKRGAITKTISFLGLYTLSVVLGTASENDMLRFSLEVNPGVVLMQNVSYRDATASGHLSIDPGPSFELALGYNLNESLLIELQSGLLLFPGSSSRVDEFGDDIHEELLQVPIMARLVYKVPLQSRFRPFVGVGVGGVYTSYEDKSDFFGGSPQTSGSDFTFGYQACVGVRYQFNRAIALGLEYDFMGTLEHDLDSLHLGQTLTHTFAVSLSFQF